MRWQVEPEERYGAVELNLDGSGRIALGGVEVPAVLPRDARRGDAVAAARRRLGELPRWLHVSGSFAGVRLWLDDGEHTVHCAFRALEPCVRDLVGALVATDPRLAAALAPLDAAPQPGPRFVHAPGGDSAPLAAILTQSSTDVPLRHLAARIAIDERAFALLPALRQAFVQSARADGLGDYFLASAALRLGDPVGLARVIDVANSSRPQWAAEAASDLTACLPSDLAGLWRAGEDHAAASARTLAAFEQHGARWHFDVDAGRYVATPAP